MVVAEQVTSARITGRVVVMVFVVVGSESPYESLFLYLGLLLPSVVAVVPPRWTWTVGTVVAGSMGCLLRCFYFLVMGCFLKSRSRVLVRSNTSAVSIAEKESVMRSERR